MDEEKKITGIRNIMLNILSVLLLCLLLFPLFWIVVTSLKTEKEIFQIPPTLFPRVLNTKSYVAQVATGDFNMFQSFGNSLVISVGATLIAVVLAVPASYGIAKYHFKGKKAILLGFLVTQMLPVSVLLTPMFILFKNTHVYNTPVAAILADATIGIPFSVLILKNYFASIPKELEEAATIDGCGSVKTLWYVIVPMLKPSIVSCALFQFMWSSNDFMGPLLYVNTPARYPASIFVKMSMDADTGFEWNRVLAMSLISIIPSLIVFLLAQDQFIDGIAAGGVKG